MNSLLPCTLALALLGATLPASAPASASGTIQRCIAPDGADVYTDKPCARLGASASPLPAELLERIARDEALERRRDPLAGTVDAARPLDAGAMPAARRAAASGCARSPAQLALDLRGAFALGDVNRLAESYHWAGMSAEAGKPVMDRLQDLSTQAVVDVRAFGSGLAGLSNGNTLLASAGRGRAAVPTGIVQLVFGDDGGRSVVDLDMHRYAGCYFVSF